MNKKGLAKKLISSFSLNPQLAEDIIECLLDTLSESLKNEEPIQLQGFATFKTKTNSERTFINPQTKEISIIKEKKSPVFKPSKLLIKAIN